MEDCGRDSTLKFHNLPNQASFKEAAGDQTGGGVDGNNFGLDALHTMH